LLTIQWNAFWAERCPTSVLFSYEKSGEDVSWTVRAVIYLNNLILLHQNTNLLDEIEQEALPLVRMDNEGGEIKSNSKQDLDILGMVVEPYKHDCLVKTGEARKSFDFTLVYMQSNTLSKTNEKKNTSQSYWGLVVDLPPIFKGLSLPNQLKIKVMDKEQI
jgi:hypothetical protein